jgi:quercetin dioxygenase-like cupin family protein
VQKTSLTALARTELHSALEASSGRSAKTVYGGHEHVLRQTLISLRAGEALAEHNNPGEATVQVLHGRVVLAAGEESWSGWTGDLIIVPDAPHSVTAVEDSSILLTVVKLR